jgi:hypothetical protein
VKQIKVPKQVAKLTAILFLTSASGCADPPHRSQAEIYIERPENSGDINIYPCTVKISSGQTAVLVGGENGLFIVEAGTYDLTAGSSNPYPMVLKDSDWISDPVEITVTNSQVMRIVVKPKSKGSIYVGGWDLEQQP